MNRRNFLKAMGAAGASIVAPSSLSLMSMYKQANAAIDYTAANIVAPSIMPQVINIFLYGGPSELSGNLTNILDIEANSQNSYVADVAFGPEILRFQNDPLDGLITPNGFWGNNSLGQNGAGGDDMQFMLDRGYMSVYRTLMKRIDGTRSHRESLLMSQKGSLDIEVSAGVGTRLAATLLQNRSMFEGITALADGTLISNLEDLFIPFVSFEGETRYFAPDPNYSLPLFMRGTTLDQNFDNPYSRGSNDNNDVLEALAGKVITNADRERFSGVVNAFDLRVKMEEIMGNLSPSVTIDDDMDSSGDLLPLVTDPADAAAIGVATGDRLVYPDPNNNRFTDRIRAAVTLALKNPNSLYITVGDGLGGWDDHNNATTDYPNRMADLFATLKAAMLHIKYSNNAPTLGDGITPGVRTTSSNIAINMLGDFGRLVNLNGAQGGWDHGNNQNLWTFGIDGPGTPRPAGALGKVVGRTERVGDSGTNNQVTEPVSGSYEAEPMSVASTVYSYFGVQNPEILTADDERNPAGVPVIDETETGEPPLF